MPNVMMMELRSLTKDLMSWMLALKLEKKAFHRFTWTLCVNSLLSLLPPLTFQDLAKIVPSYSAMLLSPSQIPDRDQAGIVSELASFPAERCLTPLLDTDNADTINSLYHLLHEIDCQSKAIDKWLSLI